MKFAFLTIFISVLGFAVTTQELQDQAIAFFSDARKAEPFRLFGKDQLKIKVVLASVDQNKIVDLNDIYQRIEEIQKKVKIEKIQFDSFEEFVAKEKSLWPASGDVVVDIERINLNGLTIVEPTFKNKTDQEIWEKNRANQALFQQTTGMAAVGSISQLALATPEQRELIQKDLTAMTSSFDLAQGRLQSMFKDMFATEGEGFLKIAFPILMAKYLEKTSARTKANILADLIQGPFPFTNEAFLKAILSNAGPQLQKLIQTLARNKQWDEKWRTLFQTFENDIRPVPIWQVEELLKRAKFPFKIVEFKPEPLGVGTIAQVHIGIVEMPDGQLEERVFRFIKPGMKERSLEEAEVIKYACLAVDTDPSIVNKGFPKLASLADNAYDLIKQDMIQVEAARNQTIGRKVYKRKDIQVPEVWLSLDEEHLFMYQTLAEGKKISKYSLEIQKKVLKRIVSVWLEEALFGSGFYHADLHQGNSMVKLIENQKGAKSELKTILDFGMFGSLSKTDRVDLLGLGVAVTMNDPKVLSQIAWRLSELSENKITKEKLLLELEAKIRANKGTPFSVAELLKFFQEIGLELNGNILGFLRGSITLGDQLAEVDPKLGLLGLASKVALKHPVQVLKLLKLKEISMSDLMNLTWRKFISPKLSGSVKAEKTNMCLKFYE